MDDVPCKGVIIATEFDPNSVAKTDSMAGWVEAKSEARAVTSASSLLMKIDAPKLLPYAPFPGKLHFWIFCKVYGSLNWQ